MSKNTLNLALRFILELLALAAMGYGAWGIHPIIGILIPVLAAAAWGTFRVPNDPKEPPIRVSGIIRLILEIVFFGLAVFLLFYAGESNLALIFGGVVLVHYALSYDRLWWLIRQ